MKFLLRARILAEIIKPRALYAVHSVTLPRMNTTMKSLSRTRRYGEKLRCRNLGNPRGCPIRIKTIK